MFKKCSIFAKYTKKKSFDCEKYLCGESVQSNKNQKNVRYCSKTNIFGFDVHIISW